MNKALLRPFLFALVVLLGGAGAYPLSAAESADLSITIKDHKFDPQQIKVAAGMPLKLTVKNLDATAEEFESRSLKVEKIVAGNASAIIRLRPLAKGSYPFVGEYHEDTAKGVLVVE